MVDIDKWRYSIVTPVRNEERVIDRTIRSVLGQTIRPEKWIILDDGSIDRTREILRSYSGVYQWIETIFTDKKVPTYWGVQEKLCIAFNRIDIDENDCIGKLDADIILSPSYFEDLMKRFYLDPSLGIAGGTLYHYEKGKRVLEKCPSEHVRGGLKFYRVECWKDIGGMEFRMGYDTIDEIKASMLGWKTRSFEEIEALHLRPTGNRMGLLRWPYYLGKDHYVAGYNPIFIVAKCAKDMAVKPYFINGAMKLAGYFTSYLKGLDRSVQDQAYLRYLRKRQISRMLTWLKRG